MPAVALRVIYQDCENPAFGKPWFCLSDTRHFRQFRLFRGKTRHFCRFRQNHLFSAGGNTTVSQNHLFKNPEFRLVEFHHAHKSQTCRGGGPH